MKSIKLRRIPFLLGISLLLFILVMSADYAFGLRRHPENLINQHKTEHFHIFTNFDSDSIDYYENLFEGFLDYFSTEYFKVNLNRRLKVYLFRNEKSYKNYVTKSYKTYTSYGFYMGPWANTIVINAESGLGTAIHELVHHFIATNFSTHPPAWIDEGIATFFEKFIGYIDSGGNLHISVGYFSNWRFPITKRNLKRLSLIQLVNSNDPDQCAARSFMLFLHKKGFFKSFIKQISVQKNDSTGLTTLQNIYGQPIDQIENQWKNWIKSQPIDGNVNLVQWAFIKTEEQWQQWKYANINKLYWNQNERVYCIKD